MTEFYRRWWRPIAAAFIIGTSAWCAAGTVAVSSAAQLSPRLFAPAPWWVALAAAGLALLVPGWRARPVTAAPALFSTIPWWPVPVPVEALLWTGVLGWVPIAAALLVAEGGRLVRLLRHVPRAHDPAGATTLAATGALVISLAAAWALSPRLPGGDEPHYLVITQSLLQDRDLQIENNHAARDYAAYYPGTIAPDYLVRGQNGAIYSIHAPGVSALVLPAFALSGHRGAQLTVILLFALTGALVWRAAWRITGDTAAAWFAWAAVVTSTTLAVLSVMVFPDAPGACAVAAGVWLLVSLRDSSPFKLTVVSASLAALPWLHTRFSVLAGLLGLAVVLLVLTDGSRAMAGRLRRSAWFLAIPLVSAAFWLWSFYAIYGSADPRVPYGPDPEVRSWIWGALAGLFLDQQFGLMTYAPVLAVGFAAVFMRASRDARTVSAICVGSFVLYAMAVSSYWMWWAGVPGLPARFLTAAIPLLAVPLAVVWLRATVAGRTALLALLAISGVVTVMVLAVDHGAMAWNRRDGQAAWLEWLNPLVNLPRMWPSFFWNGQREFLVHALVLVIVTVAVWLLLRALARRAGDDAARRRLTMSVCMLVGTMLVAASGWEVTNGSPLDPARAQLRLHAAGGRGGALVIRSDQAPLVDRPSAAVMTLTRVPPGTYGLHVSFPGGQTGARPVSVTIGRSASPVYRFDAPGVAGQAGQFTLPAGAAVLVISAATPEIARALDVSVTPVSSAVPADGLARAFSRFGDIDAFFLDDNVFAEAAGFWVRGGRTASVVLAGQGASAGPPRSLHLRNGGAPNTVIVRSGNWEERLSLAAGEERAVVLPAANALGAWPLTITSSSGFQPSATTGGADTRYLGVWVQ